MSSVRFGSTPSSPEQDEARSLREQLASRSKSLERTLGVRAERTGPRACLRPAHYCSPLGSGRGCCRQRASAPRRRQPTAASGLPRARLWKNEAGLCRGEDLRALAGRSARSYTWVCRVMLPSREHLNTCFHMFYHQLLNPVTLARDLLRRRWYAMRS